MSTLVETTTFPVGTPAGAEWFSPGSLAAWNREAHRSSIVHDRILVGSDFLLVRNAYGSSVEPVGETQIAIRRRPVPIFLRPPAPPDILGRACEIAAAESALRSIGSFQFHSESGWGKTALLQHLAHHLPRGPFPDGVVYQRVHGHALADLLQLLFDAFYEADAPIKPSAAQLRDCLLPLRALILLDDVDLSPYQLEQLVTAAPTCTFLVASDDRPLLPAERRAAVMALEEEPALDLFEHTLGRPLTIAERPAVQRLWAILEGHPRRLIEAAGLARDARMELEQVVARVHPKSPFEDLSAVVFESLDETERAVLALLAALKGAAVLAEHVARVTGLADAASLLESLDRRGLVDADAEGFRFESALSLSFALALAPSRWTELLVQDFTGWAEQHAGHPDVLLGSWSALQGVLDLAHNSERREETLRLVRATEAALSLAGRWSAWERVLEQGLESARALNDRAAEAWALHQLGVRLLCLGDRQHAAVSLRKALAVRRSVGDAEGASLTRHDLARAGKPRRVRIRPRASRLAKVMAVFATLVATGAAWGISHAAFFGPAASRPAASHAPSASATIPGLASLDPGTVDFGKQTVGLASSAKEVVLRNAGDAPVAISQVTVSGDFELAGQCPGGASPLPKGGACTISIRFTPTAHGHRDGSLAVTAADGAQLQAALRGMGVLPQADLPGLLDWGMVPVESPRVRILAVRNSGEGVLRVSSIRLDPQSHAAFSLSRDGCSGIAVVPGESCAAEIRFLPRAGPTTRFVGKLLVTHNGSPDPLTVSLRASTPAPSPSATPVGPLVRADQATLDFGKQKVGTTSPRQVVTVFNSGDAPAHLSTALSAEFAADTACVATLLPGSSCPIGVTFRPSGTGERSGTLTLTGDTSLSVSLRGVGAIPKVAFLPTVLNFFTVPLPTAKTANVVVTNTGEVALSIRRVTSDLKDYTVKSACREMLDPNRSCNIAVMFSPQLKGSRPAMLIIEHDAPGTPQKVMLLGKGI